jgi:transcriptional regulator with XRE-family HTH domain
VRPEAVGIEAGLRRRTPGLRREEVAARAAVGVSWYTWLEQGRAVTPSVQVLEALGRALLLSPSEREHLFLLAGLAVPVAPGLIGVPLDDDTVVMVAGLAPHPAYVLGPRFDVLAHNQPAELILDDLLTWPPGRRNLLRWLFQREKDWVGMESTWRRTAHANLLDFRREYAGRENDPEFAELVDDLIRSSESFRSWWADHDVLALTSTVKQIPHRRVGPLRLRQLQSRPEHRPELRLRILVPDDDATRQALTGSQATMRRPVRP